MDFTQNERLAQITEETIIIGIDIAKHKHVARAIDDRGRDLAKRLVFSNTFGGFKELMDWAKALSIEHQKLQLILGMEPTGHYWLNLAYYLKAQEKHIVVVNP